MSANVRNLIVSAPISKLYEQSTLVSKSLRIARKNRIVRLEPEVWEALDEIAATKNMSISALSCEVAREPTTGSFTSAVPSYVVRWLLDERSRNS
jgi:predicted DNA-binding ribbon-helix-helix protein